MTDPKEVIPAVFEAVRTAQLIEGSKDFLKPWNSQPQDAKQFWRKVQAIYDMPNEPHINAAGDQS